MTAPSRLCTAFLSISLLLGGPALAARYESGLLDPHAVAKEAQVEDGTMLLAHADCSAAAAQAAAQTGGQVLSVSSSNQGGQTVCVVTVLVPGQGGERPRRTTITLPG